MLTAGWSCVLGHFFRQINQTLVRQDKNSGAHMTSEGVQVGQLCNSLTLASFHIHKCFAGKMSTLRGRYWPLKSCRRP